MMKIIRGGVKHPVVSSSEADSMNECNTLSIIYRRCASRRDVFVTIFMRLR